LLELEEDFFELEEDFLLEEELFFLLEEAAFFTSGRIAFLQEMPPNRDLVHRISSEESSSTSMSSAFEDNAQMAKSKSMAVRAGFIFVC
jgi:hypothetical protein